jgi:hypothetical protein
MTIIGRSCPHPSLGIIALNSRHFAMGDVLYAPNGCGKTLRVKCGPCNVVLHHSSRSSFLTIRDLVDCRKCEQSGQRRAWRGPGTVFAATVPIFADGLGHGSRRAVGDESPTEIQDRSGRRRPQGWNCLWREPRDVAVRALRAWIDASGIGLGAKCSAHGRDGVRLIVRISRIRARPYFSQLFRAPQSVHVSRVDSCPQCIAVIRFGSGNPVWVWDCAA